MKNKNNEAFISKISVYWEQLTKKIKYNCNVVI